jgi:hypothetical protein
MSGSLVEHVNAYSLRFTSTQTSNENDVDCCIWQGCRSFIGTQLLHS